MIKNTNMFLNPFTLNAKIKKIIFWSSIGFLIIISRLFYLQINLTNYFFNRSQQNFLRTESIYSLRGNILDCNGNLLATNRPVTDLYWQGTGNIRLSADQQRNLKTIELILNKTILDDTNLLTHITFQERHHKQALIAKDISFDQLSKIEEQLPNTLNIHIQTNYQRHYPYKSFASHVLGYLGRSVDIGSAGKMGLEKIFEEALKGQDGKISKTINSVGKDLTKKTIQNSLAGHDIQTTININLQKISEKIFPQDSAGALLLLDPHDGGLVSLVSRPDFDPEIFLHPISQNEWDKIQKNGPFLNRAFNASYPPGSIFKLVTVSAALEHGYIEPHSTVNCPGYTFFANRKYWCSRHYGHGNLTTGQALAQSCNILFFDIGKQMDVDLLSQYATKFGLGKKTNIIFPEHGGLVPTRNWKQETKGEAWWQGETLSVSIGQSFLLTTPIQIARMIASIFTGYLVKPRILANEAVEKKLLDVHPETLAFLRKSMKSVITKGTGRRVSQVKDIQIYAKTSTAQISSLHKRKLDESYKEHGWFVAYFSYKDSTPLVLVIVIENAGTSQVPTTIAKNFLLEYKDYFDRQKTLM